MKYLVGNWKMAPLTEAKFDELARDLFESFKEPRRETEVVLCPPFVWLAKLSELIGVSGIFSLGAQNCFWSNDAAHTGEVAPKMLKSLGVSYVIVGHSERRALGESNDVVAKKLRAVVEEKMTAILCVGEISKEGDWPLFIKDEVESALSVLKKEDLKRLVVAYEPIWAIGASKPDTPDDALTSALLIRKLVRERFGEKFAKELPVLYGGSVSKDSIKPFAAQEGIDGVLVGRASLLAEDFGSMRDILNRD